MSLRGVVHGRTIELEEDPRLSDGTTVEVELQTPRPQRTPTPSLSQRLKQAAQQLREDYLNEPELTAFSALDGEAWHE